MRLPLLLTALALLATAPRAQAVLDDFDDDDLSNVFVFSEADAGITTSGGGGVLSVSIDPGAVGGFLGIGIGAPDGNNVDASDATDLTVPLTATAGSGGMTNPFSFVVNIQEDSDGDGTFEGDTEDEFQAVANVTVDGILRVLTIPLDGFTDSNGGGDGVLDRTLIRNVVFISGGSNSLGSPFTLRFDEIVFTGEDPNLGPGTLAFNDFEDGTVSEVFPFSGASNNAGASVEATDGAVGTTTGAAVTIDPAATNGFVGFGFGASTGTTFDATGAQAVTFYLRSAFGANTNPFTLIVKLVEDTDGDGVSDPTVDDEFQGAISVSGGTGYGLVSVPISAFTDGDPAAGANDGFDLASMQNVVFVIAGTGSLGDPFTLSVDEVAFAIAGNTSAAGPQAGADLSLSIRPNPATSQARVAFELATSANVRVDVFDMVGRHVSSAFGGQRPAGAATVDFDVSALAAGVYVVRVAASGAVASQTVWVVR